MRIDNDVWFLVFNSGVSGSRKDLRSHLRMNERPCEDLGVPEINLSVDSDRSDQSSDEYSDHPGSAFVIIVVPSHI